MYTLSRCHAVCVFCSRSHQILQLTLQATVTVGAGRQMKTVQKTFGKLSFIGKLKKMTYEMKYIYLRGVCMCVDGVYL